jgi:hypothetical protein
MNITETETLFRKVGRKYVPAYSLSEWSYDKDMMPVGSFRLVHAYSDGGRRYAYERHPRHRCMGGRCHAGSARHDRGHPQSQPTHDCQRYAVDEKTASRYCASERHSGSRWHLEQARMDDSSGARRGTGRY